MMLCRVFLIWFMTTVFYGMKLHLTTQKTDVSRSNLMDRLKVQYVKIGDLLNSYSKQIEGSVAPG